MSVLQEIKRDIPVAARRLERADLHSDSEILSLTREDLHDLFPGAENFQLRRRVYEIIHRQKPIGVLKELQQLIQHESLCAALTNNGVLDECPHILKDLKTQVNNVESLLESRLSLPESISNNQQDPEPNKGCNADADMSVLQEIKRDIPVAAWRLEQAGLHSDSEILSLTQEDLRDLFPGTKNFQLRRRVYEIIHRQKPIGVLKEMQQLIQHESLRAALTNNGVLVECLPILKDLKTQVNNYRSLLESRLSLRESISSNQQDLEPNKGCNADADMSVLLNEIKRFSPEAASTLKRAGLRSESEILSLTREDLPDLFPGAENFQLRRRVYEIIHRQKPIGVQKELQQFIQHESLRGSLPSTSAPSNPGECHKNQTDDHPQEAKDADMSVLQEEIKRDIPDAASMLERTTGFMGWLLSPRTGGRPQKSQSFSFTVTYEVVVCGKTFDAHLQLMNFVKSPVQDWLQFIESSEDSQVVVVFCPITSRIGWDVEAAMREVKAEKPVILVLMHHRRDPGSTNFGRTWDNPNVVLCVSVFYHETINGLVKCDENNVAVDKIRRKLMEYKTEVKIPMEMDG